MTATLQNITQGAYALAYQLVGQRDDALDIIQDAAMVALSHENAPTIGSNIFKPWFYKVVRNKALDKLRRHQRFSHETIEDDSFLHGKTSASVDEPHNQLQHMELKATIEKALMAVNLEQREIVLLKDYHGFNYAQIAEILDIPSGSVMSRLHRARLALRKLLKEYKSGDE